MKISFKNNVSEPLVTILVITYNSSEFIIETLKSVMLQTYRNIELIVSDDGSQDNTVVLCKDWIEENKERFINTRIIEVKKNTGIPANCNRGLKESKGEWLKYIAGDDVLFNTCIEDCLGFVKQSDEEISVLIA